MDHKHTNFKDCEYLSSTSNNNNSNNSNSNNSIGSTNSSYETMISYFDQFLRQVVLKEVRSEQKEKVEKEWNYFKDLLIVSSSNPLRVKIFFDVLQKSSPTSKNSIDSTSTTLNTGYPISNIPPLHDAFFSPWNSPLVGPKRDSLLSNNLQIDELITRRPSFITPTIIPSQIEKLTLGSNFQIPSDSISPRLASIPEYQPLLPFASQPSSNKILNVSITQSYSVVIADKCDGNCLGEANKIIKKEKYDKIALVLDPVQPVNSSDNFQNCQIVKTNCHQPFQENNSANKENSLSFKDLPPIPSILKDNSNFQKENSYQSLKDVQINKENEIISQLQGITKKESNIKEFSSIKNGYNKQIPDKNNINDKNSNEFKFQREKIRQSVSNILTLFKENNIQIKRAEEQQNQENNINLTLPKSPQYSSFEHKKFVPYSSGINCPSPLNNVLNDQASPLAPIPSLIPSPSLPSYPTLAGILSSNQPVTQHNMLYGLSEATINTLKGVQTNRISSYQQNGIKRSGSFQIGSTFNQYKI